MKDTMKVLCVTNIPSPYRVDFFNELSQFCDLTVVYEQKLDLSRNKNWTFDDQEKYKHIYLKGISVRSDAAICFGISATLKKDWDIIIVHGYSTPTQMIAILNLNLHHKNFLMCVDGGFIKNDSRIKYLFKKYLVSSAKVWLSTGASVNSYLQHYGANLNDTYFYPFTSIREKDISLTNENSLKIKNDLSMKEEKIVLMVGQFIKRKGIDVLLEACRDLDNNIGIYIVGDEAPDEYLNYKRDYALENVHFVGFKKKEQLQDYYKCADVFVLPTREDIWGLVINEAMTFGLPIITTNRCVAGLELVKDGVNGYIVPVEDAGALANKINKILADGNQATEMRKKSIEIIREYTIEKMALTHMEIFNRYLEKNRDK